MKEERDPLWVWITSIGLSLLLLISFVLMLTAATRAFASDHPVPPKGERFTCTPVAVWDGDGPIWCAEGERIRLTGIAAREIDGTCRRGHPCPAASGIAARDSLVELLGGSLGTLRSGHIRVAGPPLACTSAGVDRYRRTLATCELPSGAELGRAQIETETAAPWRYR